MFEWVKNHGGEPIIPFSGVFESKLVDMPEDERDKYCKEVCLVVPSAKNHKLVLHIHCEPKHGNGRTVCHGW